MKSTQLALTLDSPAATISIPTPRLCLAPLLLFPPLHSSSVNAFEPVRSILGIHSFLMYTLRLHLNKFVQVVVLTLVFLSLLLGLQRFSPHPWSNVSCLSSKPLSLWCDIGSC
jgi:hypothetical protein